MASQMPDELRDTMYESAPPSIQAEVEGREDEVYEKILAWVDKAGLSDCLAEVEVIAARMAPWLLASSDVRRKYYQQDLKNEKDIVNKEVEALDTLVEQERLLHKLNLDQKKVELELFYAQEDQREQRRKKKAEWYHDLYVHLGVSLIPILEKRGILVEEQKFIILDLFKIFNFENYNELDMHNAIENIRKIREKALRYFPERKKKKKKHFATHSPTSSNSLPDNHNR